MPVAGERKDELRKKYQQGTETVSLEVKVLRVIFEDLRIQKSYLNLAAVFQDSLEDYPEIYCH